MSGQRNPPVFTNTAAAPCDRLFKIAHFQLGHCYFQTRPLSEKGGYRGRVLS